MEDEKFRLVDQNAAGSIGFQQGFDLLALLIPTIMPELDHFWIIVKDLQRSLDSLHVLGRAVKARGILQQKRTELTRLGDGFKTGAELIDIVLRRRLPFFISFVSPNLYRMRKLLPQLQGKGEVG